MIARKKFSEKFLEWNRREGAPFGHPVRGERIARRLLPSGAYLRLRGPFSIQPNNTTRAFEYPWASSVAGLKPGMRVLEVGGGLAGFQFFLSRFGCEVVNVDPGLAAEGVGWKCDLASLEALNRVFGTSVELRNTLITRADLSPGSFDRAFSISVIEHLEERELAEVMLEVYRCLKSGGLFTITLDLSLNLEPFTSRLTNQYGRNVNVKQLVEFAPFDLVHGDRSELFGFPEFSADRIQSQLEDLLIGAYPALVQCLVLRKP